jgi:hypothetical protein
MALRRGVDRPGHGGTFGFPPLLFCFKEVQVLNLGKPALKKAQRKTKSIEDRHASAC